MAKDETGCSIAIALMQEALARLDEAEEHAAAAYLQHSIDLVEKGMDLSPQ